MRRSVLLFMALSLVACQTAADDFELGRGKARPAGGGSASPTAGAAGVFDALVEGELRTFGGRAVERRLPQRSAEIGGRAAAGPLLAGPARQAGLRARRPGRIQHTHVVGRWLDGRTDAGKRFKAVGLRGP